MRELKKSIWPSRIKIGLIEYGSKHNEIETWLSENLGVVKGRWNEVVVGNNVVYYYFKSQADATLFALRWS